METRREDVGIAFRSAFLSKGIKQKFSLFVLVIISVILIFLETVNSTPLNYFRSFIKDTIYRGSQIVSTPSNGIGYLFDQIKIHMNLHKNYTQLMKENNELKNDISKSDYLELQNIQLKQIVNEKMESSYLLTTASVMIDKQSPYRNSFILNIGANKNIKNGLAVLHGKNFIGRIVDVNFFSSRVLLISDLNSRIPVLIEPSGNHSILRGYGINETILDFLPENHSIENGDKVYTSGMEGIFSPGIPIGKIKIKGDNINVLLFSDLGQINYVNIITGNLENNK